MANSQHTKIDSGKVIVQDVQLEDITDVVEPPLQDFKSKFKTLQDWLFNICDNNKPIKSITEFRFNYFESSGEYTIFLVGINTYDDEENRSITRIEFKPSDMYFKLPTNQYKNINSEQLQDTLISQLKDFTNTEKFKTSFLAQGDAITLGFSDERIWQKFQTIQDWLINVCNDYNPKKPIRQFTFKLWESSGRYSLFFFGINRIDEKNKRSITAGDVLPSIMWFQLPKDEYTNLNSEQLQDTLTRQLKDFTNTEKFKNSFFSKADTVEFNGQTIWAK